MRKKITALVKAKIKKKIIQFLNYLHKVSHQIQMLRNYHQVSQCQYGRGLLRGKVSESKLAVILLPLPLGLADSQVNRPWLPGCEVGHGCGIMAGSFHPVSLKKKI